MLRPPQFMGLINLSLANGARRTPNETKREYENKWPEGVTEINCC